MTIATLDTVEPAVLPVAEPAVEVIDEPVVEVATEPLVEPAVLPVAEPIVEPILERVGVPVIEPVAKPAVAPPSRPRGRATKLSPEVQAVILVAVRAGASLDTAARAADVSPHTVREWRRRGKGQDDRPSAEPYATFARLFEKSQAVFEIRSLQAIHEAARSGQWRASAWILERRFPQRWGRKPRAPAAPRRRPRTVDAPAPPFVSSDNDLFEEGEPWEEEREFLEEGEVWEDEGGWMRDERPTLKLPQCALGTPGP